MWRAAAILVLLAGSPAFAGQARAVIQVGFTITGNAAQTPAKATTVAGSQGAARAAAVKPSPQARPRRAQ
jgi:hypothetical protein